MRLLVFIIALTVSQYAFAQDSKSSEIRIVFELESEVGFSSEVVWQSIPVRVNNRGYCELTFQTNYLDCLVNTKNEFALTKQMLKQMVVIAMVNSRDYYEKQLLRSISASLDDVAVSNVFGPLKLRKKRSVKGEFELSSERKLTVTLTAVRNLN